MSRFIAGRFEVVRQLGEGGSSQVHLVRDRLNAQRHVALKMVPAQWTEHAQREFRQLSGFCHPGIAQAYESAIDPASGATLLLLEYVPGSDFRADFRQLPELQRYRLVGDLLRTLEFVHSRGVLHRDLKPDNMILTDGDTGARVVLIDFGLAREAAAGAELAGSLPYLAPELFAGVTHRVQSDLYALGISLYEVWCGRLPFEADSGVEWGRAHQSAAAHFTAEDAVSAPVQSFLLRLLAKNPADRYSSAAAALVDFSQLVSDNQPLLTSAGLRGAIHSFPEPWPAHQEEWQPRPPAEGESVGLTWIHDPVEGSRRHLAATLRAEMAVEGKPVLGIRFGPRPESAPAPLMLLRDQAAAWAGVTLQARHEFDLDLEPLCAAMRDRPATIFIEEGHRRSCEAEPWLRRLLRGPIPVVLSSAVEPASDEFFREFVAERRAPIRLVTPRKIGWDELHALQPTWLGDEPPPSLTELLRYDGTVAIAELIQRLDYLVDCGALAIEAGKFRCDPNLADRGVVAGDLRELLVHRLRLLSTCQQRVLEAAAVLGEPASASTIQRVFGDSESVTPTLTELQGAGLLDRANANLSGTLWRVSRQLPRTLILESVEQNRLVDLHRRAAAELELDDEAEDRALRVTRHRLAAGESDPATLHAAVTSADALRRAGCHGDASSLLDAMPTELPEEEEIPARVALVRGQLALRRGSTAEAEEHFDRAESISSDPEIRCTAVLEGARTRERSGRAEAALEALDRVDANGLEDPQRASWMLRRAFVLYRLGRKREAETCCLHADHRLPHEPSEDRIRLHNTLGLVLGERGDAPAARAQFRQAITFSRAAANPIWMIGPMHNLARVELGEGQLRRAVELFEESRRWADRYGDRQTGAMIATTVGPTLLRLGRLDDAKRILHDGRQELEAVLLGGGHRRQLRQLQAQLAMAEGDLEMARNEIAKARAAADEHGDARGRRLCDLMDLAVLSRLGEVDSVRELEPALADCLQQDEDPELRDYAATYLLDSASFRSDAQAVAKLMETVGAVGTQPLLRRCDLWLARLRGLACLQDFGVLVQEAQVAERDLEHSDFIAHRVLARAFADHARCVLSGSSPTEADVRDAIEQLRERGHRLQRAEALYLWAAPRQDRVALREARDLASKFGHAPLLARVQAMLDEGDDDEVTLGLRRQVQVLEKVKELARTINSEHEGDRLLRVVLDRAIEESSAKRGFLILLRGGAMSFPVARNIELADIENPQFSVSSSIARRVALDGVACLSSDATSDTRFKHASSISQLRLLSVMCAPLRRGEDVVGAIYVDDPTRIDAFDEHDLHLLEELSGHAAIALEKAELLRVNTEHSRQIERKNQEIEQLNRQLQATVAAQAQELVEVKETLRAAQDELRYDYSAIVHCSRAMREALTMVDRIADSDFPVLLFGESGTGKELFARAIYQNGRRAKRPFYSINCASIPGGLIESELFGHVRGAFTGADRDRAGVFELADGGTLFLDELGDASLELQAKLLRVIQFGEIARLGSDQVQRVDVRVISATNRTLAEEVEGGRFRQDLFYRLQVHGLRLPPLRERPEDVPLLLEHFQSVHVARTGGREAKLRFTAAALDQLRRYRWPGNVRELEHLVIDLMVRCADGQAVEPAVLPDKFRAPEAIATQPAEGKSLKEIVEATECSVIERALRECGGVRAKAARLLGMSERNLYKKLHKHGLLGGADGDAEE